MKFAVFLDVDGVLNTKTTVERSPEDYKGILKYLGLHRRLHRWKRLFF